MARVQPTARLLINHPPQEYYELWAVTVGIDVTKYPYLKMDVAEPNGKLVPFGVYDFDYLRTEDGHKVAAVLVRYKALFSKHEFTVQAYL